MKLNNRKINENFVNLNRHFRELAVAIENGDLHEIFAKSTGVQLYAEKLEVQADLLLQYATLDPKAH